MKHLYHGSPKKLKGDRLIAKKAEDLEQNPENTKKAVYATDIKEQAIAMAIICSKGVHGASLGNYGKQKYGKIYLGKIKQKYVYLHILPKKTFKKCKTEKNQYFSEKPVKPIKTEKIKIEDYLFLIKYATKKQSKAWCKKFKVK